MWAASKLVVGGTVGKGKGGLDTRAWNVRKSEAQIPLVCCPDARLGALDPAKS